MPVNNNHRNIYLNSVTWIIRVLTGLTFIFSGFVKAIDPWGTIFKVEDYLGALSLSVWPNLILVGVFLLCGTEFLIGVFLLLGCFRRSTAIFTTLFMSVMLCLTLWIAISDPVADCGCFGDAIKLSNWATFWKNVFLFAGALWLSFYSHRCRYLITPALQWLCVVGSGIFIVSVELYGYISQPLLDFRQYKVGEPLIDEDENDTPKYEFIYEKEGERVIFSSNDVLPDESEGWQFIDRKEIETQDKSPDRSPSRNNLKNFRIWDKDGEEDMTFEISDHEGAQILILIPDLKAVSPATTWKLNSLYEWSGKHDISMLGIVAGSHKEIDEWEDISMSSYPVYTAEDTQIKELVRGNPGVVYLENGMVKWKSTLSALNVDDFLSPDIPEDVIALTPDHKLILRNILMIYLIFIILLVFSSSIPVKRMSKMQVKELNHNTKDLFIHDDKVHSSEES